MELAHSDPSLEKAGNARDRKRSARTWYRRRTIIPTRLSTWWPDPCEDGVSARSRGVDTVSNTETFYRHFMAPQRSQWTTLPLLLKASRRTRQIEALRDGNTVIGTVTMFPTRSAQSRPVPQGCSSRSHQSAAPPLAIKSWSSRGGCANADVRLPLIRQSRW